MKVKIGEKFVGEGNPAFIIAEAGINHNGSMKIAKKMVDKAVQSQVDAIKFQTFKANDLASKESPYYKIFKKCELETSEFEEIADYTRSQGITFCSTPFSQDAVDILHKLKVPVFKISSGDLTHIPLISYTATKKKPIILSTGMANLDEIIDAVKTIEKQKNKKIIILHSVAGYPTPNDETNLNTINFLREHFDHPIGYSDNGAGLVVPLTAIATGAKIIEKHFTLDQKMKGPDHSFSATPKQLTELVKQTREIENILGDKEKKCQKCEFENRTNARRGIKTSVLIKKGTKISSDKISIKRPAKGILPKDLNKILGKIVKQDIGKNKILHWKDIKKK